jgi:hypothetical protein
MIRPVKQLGFSSPAIPKSKGRNMKRIQCLCFSESLQQRNNFIYPLNSSLGILCLLNTL